MLGKKIRYWAICFVLGYIENGQKKFAKDSDMYKAYEKVILDVQGKYKYRWNSYFICEMEESIRKIDRKI